MDPRNNLPRRPRPQILFPRRRRIVPKPTVADANADAESEAEKPVRHVPRSHLLVTNVGRRRDRILKRTLGIVRKVVQMDCIAGDDFEVAIAIATRDPRNPEKGFNCFASSSDAEPLAVWEKWRKRLDFEERRPRKRKKFTRYCNVKDPNSVPDALFSFPHDSIFPDPHERGFRDGDQHDEIVWDSMNYQDRAARIDSEEEEEEEEEEEPTVVVVANRVAESRANESESESESENENDSENENQNQSQSQSQSQSESESESESDDYDSQPFMTARMVRRDHRSAASSLVLARSFFLSERSENPRHSRLLPDRRALAARSPRNAIAALEHLSKFFRSNDRFQ